MIIDSHLHFPETNEEFSFEQAKEKLLSDMERNGVDYGILIPDNVKDSKIGDLDTCLDLLKNEDKLFLLGTIDIENSDKKEVNKLENLFQKGKIRGAKIFPGHDPIYPTDERLKPLYNLCVKYDYPLVIHTGSALNDLESAKYNDPKYIVEIASLYPALKIIIAHYFWPKIEYCYKITRPYKNIYFDTSALADEEVIKETGLDRIKEVLKKTIKDNLNSVLFGTDYAMCSFKDHIDLINSLDLSEKEKEKVFCKNIIDLFKLRDSFRFS